MKIAVLSGKGGTGKTFISVNLAAAAKESTYIDCDVEEPNGRLFWRPDAVQSTPVYVKLPRFDAEKCSGCRTCIDFCRFNALAYIRNTPRVFFEVCHSCGGCALVCPEKAITEENRQVGIVEQGRHGEVRVITGVMNIGEESGGPVIKAELRQTFPDDGIVIIDCPPGSACSVMESVSYADYCILAAEPTSFGLYNFQMVYELVALLKKPCCAVINKADAPYPPLERFCAEHHIPILLSVPYREELALWGANAQIAAECSEEYHLLFRELLQRILREVRK